MKTNKKFRILAIATAMLVFSAHGLLGTVRSSSDLVLEDYVTPIYPLTLKAKGVTDGTMTALLDIDVDGKVVDWLPLRASDPAFIRSFERVVDRWKFVPVVVDGQPQHLIKEVTLRFRLEGAIVRMDVAQYVANNVLRERFGVSDGSDYRVSELSELDQIPRPIHVVRPEVPRIPEAAQRSNASIEFFIDEEGNVRMPRVLSSDAPEIYLSQAYLSLMQWKFEAPKLKGKTVVSRAVQPFVFDNR